MMTTPNPAASSIDMSAMLEGFFHRYGWEFEHREEHLFRTGFVGETGKYDIWLRLTEHWIYFIIHPYVEAVTSKVAKAELCHALLEANFTINMAKFAMDDEGEVTLSVELPIADFQYSHFADALTAISHYADDHRATFEAARMPPSSMWSESLHVV